MGENRVSAKIGSENIQVVDFLMARTLELQEKLEEMGYKAEVTCWVQGPAAMKIENVLEQVLMSSTT